MLRIFKKSKNELSDQELLEAFQKEGDTRILAELYTRYTHMVYGVCMKYFADADDASDAVMNIYEKLCTDIHRHQILKFSTWLYVSTRNHCLMELRSRKTREKHQELWQNEQLLFMESQEFVHPIDDGELHSKQLKLCLDQLKKEQKECIRLFYYENKCYLEIARTLQLEEKAVKSHLQNGKRNLKICMENVHEQKEA